MKRQTHHEWYAKVKKLRAELESQPDDLELAKNFWAAVSGTAGYDVRSGKRLIDTFRTCALKTDEGLAELILAFRKLADEAGEYPRPDLLDPPLENLLRFVARQANHALSGDAAWVLSFIENEV